MPPRIKAIASVDLPLPLVPGSRMPRPLEATPAACSP
jgi:hypothetical protein